MWVVLFQIVHYILLSPEVTTFFNSELETNGEDSKHDILSPINEIRHYKGLCLIKIIRCSCDYFRKLADTNVN